ncbi:unnamed protein product, partial [Nesidiocoris tenuis]
MVVIFSRDGNVTFFTSCAGNSILILFEMPVIMKRSLIIDVKSVSHVRPFPPGEATGRSASASGIPSCSQGRRIDPSFTSDRSHRPSGQTGSLVVVCGPTRLFLQGSKCGSIPAWQDAANRCNFILLK